MNSNFLEFDRGEIFVNRRDNLRSVAHCGCDAFDRRRANVADSENPAAAGLERQAVLVDFLSGENEPSRVERDPWLPKPVGIGFGADERKKIATLRVLTSPDERLRMDTLSRVPSEPLRLSTSHPTTTSTLGRLSIRSIRYCDIVSDKERRATTVTLRARLARKRLPVRHCFRRRPE